MKQRKSLEKNKRNDTHKRNKKLQRLLGFKREISNETKKKSRKKKRNDTHKRNKKTPKAIGLQTGDIK